MSRVVLYGRHGCCLCDDARALLRSAGVPFTEVDIESDDVLHKRYLVRIPVITLDGEEVAEGIVQNADLAPLLGTVTDR